MFLLALGFLVYKSPAIMTYLFVDMPQYSIPFFSVSIIAFNAAGYYLDRKANKLDKMHKSLKEKLKDAKRMLLSNMDPILVESLKSIVRADMKNELETMRNSDLGCSEKCQVSNRILQIDKERNSKIAKELLEFRWCDVCYNQ